MLALLALATQSLMPGAMAAASTSRPDMAAILCAMPEQDMAAVSGVGVDLARLIQKKQSDSTDMDHDCPACVLAHSATLPEPVVLTAPQGRAAAQTAPRFEVRFAQVPRGPPVGSRAPPALVNA
jgi:hypothetical protein